MRIAGRLFPLPPREAEESPLIDYFSPSTTEDQRRAMSNLGLAHLGDCVYELLVRTWLCLHGGATNRQLHRATVEYVSASAQARAAEKLLPLRTEEEQDVFRRGRNARVGAIPRHATPGDYHAATGLECLFGYLYLKGEKDRINFLFDRILASD